MKINQMHSKEVVPELNDGLVAMQRPDLLDLIEPCLPYVDYFMPGFEEAIMMCGLTDRQKLEAQMTCVIFHHGPFVSGADFCQ